MLNVVNFGGGSYVLYAEIKEEEGEIEVDPEPYSDNFDRPARLLPVEAKALVAAIDLIGEHIPEGSLDVGAQEDRRGARRGPDGAGAAGGADRRRRLRTSRAWSPRRSSQRLMIELEYYKENEDELSPAPRRAVRADERPRGLVRGLVRPRARRRAPLPPRSHQARRRHRREVRAAARGRSGGRGRRLAAHGRGAGVAQRARVGLAGARALGARGAARRRGVEATAQLSSS